jgi:rRNA maturation protein Nop10
MGIKLKIIIGALLSVFGFLISTLGILFLISSTEKSSRLISGSVIFVIGLAFVIPGIIFFRKGIKSTPASVRKKILKIAAIYNGKFSKDLLIGNIDADSILQNQINIFIKSGLINEIIENGKIYYTYPDFQLKLVMKKCPYCTNDYPVRDGLEICPSCGGDLKLLSKESSDINDKYSMDI